MQSDKREDIIKASTKEEIAKLYQEFRMPLFQYILARVSHREATEDIVSIVFIRFFKYITNTENKEKHHYKGLLYTIAKGEIIDHYKRSQKSISVDVEEIDILDEESIGIEEEIDQHISIAAMYEGMSELSQEYQGLIRLRYLEQLEYEEIADILGKSQASIRVGVHRALKMLKDRLSSWPRPGSDRILVKPE